MYLACVCDSIKLFRIKQAPQFVNPLTYAGAYIIQFSCCPKQTLIPTSTANVTRFTFPAFFCVFLSFSLDGPEFESGAPSHASVALEGT